MTLVRLGWSHPDWRPWRRWAAPKAEAAEGQAQVAGDGWLHPDRFPWLRLILFALLLIAFAVVGLKTVLHLRRSSSPPERARYFAGLAEIHNEIGDPAASAAALERAVAIWPDPKYAQGLAALYAGPLQQPAESERSLRVAIENHPSDVGLRIELSQHLERRGALAEAWPVLEPAWRSLELKNEAHVATLIRAGKAALLGGRLPQAQEVFTHLSQRGSDGARAIAHAFLGDIWAARGKARLAQAAYAASAAIEDRPAISVALARATIQMGELDQAEELLRKLASEAQTRAEASQLLGSLLVYRGRVEEAARVAAELGASPEEQAAACHVRADIAISGGDFAQADAQYRRMIELHPGSARPHLLSATLAMRKGRNEDCRKHLEAALALQPAVEEAELGLLELEAREAKWSAVCTRAIRLAHSPLARPRALGALAQAYAQRGVNAQEVLAQLVPLAEREDDPLLRLYCSAFRILADPSAGTEHLARDADVVSALGLMVHLEEERSGSIEALELLRELLKRSPTEARARRVLAGMYERMGRPDLAARELDVVVASAPDLKEAHIDRARLAAAAGDLDRAAAELELLEDDVGALCVLGDIRVAQRRWPQAAAALQAAIGHAPAHAPLYARLGRVRALEGKLAEALDCFARARELDRTLPDGHQHCALLLRQRKWEEAQAALLEARQATGDARYEGALAAVALLRGQPSEAQTHLQAWSSDAESAPEKAVIAALTGSPPGDAPPEVPEMVWTAVRVGDAPRSLVVFGLRVLGWVHEAGLEANALAKDETATPLELWLAYRMVRDTAAPDEVCELLRRLLARIPAHRELSVAAARVELARKRPAAALEDLRPVLERDPGDATARLLLAGSLAAAGDDQAACSEYERLIAGGAAPAVAYNNLAHRLGRIPQQRARAIELARKAVSLEDRPEFRDTLGTLLLESGASQESIEHLRRAAAALPTQPTVRFHLAKALLQAGQDRQGINHLRMSLLSSDFPEREEALRLLGVAAPGVDCLAPEEELPSGPRTTREGE